MKEITESQAIINAEKVLAGVQLITENAQSVIDSGIVSHKSKFILRTLLNHSLKMEKSFWNLMDDSAILEFNTRIQKIEKIIEESNI